MDKEFKKFLNKEIQEMLRHKWIESERAGRDLGQEAIQDWIKRFGKSFRGKYCKDDLMGIIKDIENVSRKVKDKGMRNRLNVIKRKADGLAKLMDKENGK